MAQTPVNVAIEKQYNAAYECYDALRNLLDELKQQRGFQAIRTQMKREFPDEPSTVEIAENAVKAYDAACGEFHLAVRQQQAENAKFLHEAAQAEAATSDS